MISWPPVRQVFFQNWVSWMLARLREIRAELKIYRRCQRSDRPHTQEEPNEIRCANPYLIRHLLVRQYRQHLDRYSNQWKGGGAVTVVVFCPAVQDRSSIRPKSCPHFQGRTGFLTLVMDVENQTKVVCNRSQLWLTSVITAHYRFVTELPAN
jgi:hypothetical protein